MLLTEGIEKTSAALPNSVDQERVDDVSTG
jgi:hypothetical protein